MNPREATPGVNRKAASTRGWLSLVVLPPVAATMLLAAVAATMLLGSVAPAFSADAIEIQIAPPPPRKVAVPPRRPGFVWAPGYYRWDGHRHVWVDGHFIPERRGSHWVPERWYEHQRRYRFVPGHWAPG